MKKYIISLTIVLFASLGIVAQPGYQAVNKLLKEYEDNSNLSKGQSFSEQNEKAFLGVFSSQNVLVSALNLDNNGIKQIPVHKFISLIQSKFDDEENISVVLSQIKINGPDKMSSSKYAYKVTAMQSFVAYNNDGSGYTSNEKIIIEIEYIVNTNVARIVSLEVSEGRTGLYLIPFAGGGLSSIKGDLASGVIGDLEQSSKFSFSFGLGLDYMITDNFGITTGFSMMSYESSFLLSGFEQEPYRTVDKDGDEYDLHATATDIVNDVSLSYIEIPIGITLRFGGFITRLGVKYGIPGKSTSEFIDGSMTTTGYYPKYSVTLYDIVEYGFDTYSMAGTEGSVEHKSTLSGFFELGYNAAISQKVSISFVGFYQTSFSSVNEAETGNLAAGNGIYTSALNVMESPKVSAYGIKVGVDIKLF